MKIHWPKDVTGLKSGPTVKYMIEMDGSVSHVSSEKSSGSKAFDDAVLDAMKKSSYRPLKAGCGPQESVVTFTLDPLTALLS
jgi:TonB family protein